MNATEELRRMLDERGVGYRWDNGTATWHVNGVMYNAWGYDSERLTMSVCHLTPEQAIEATIGRTTTRHGKHKTRWGREVPLCERCGYAIGDSRYHYCPNCGAKVVE